MCLDLDPEPMKAAAFIVFTAVIATAGWARSNGADGGSCERILGLSRTDLLITTATSVAEGPYLAPGMAIPFRMPAFCRVTGTLKPSEDSRINFELWMP